MAIAEYVVICDQEATKGKTQTEPEWSGAATGAAVLAVRSARYILVNAESTAEAIKGVKALYPGWIKTKCVAFEKAGAEEA